MSTTHIATIVERSVFRPRTNFRQLGHDHIPFDELTNSERFEAVARRELTSGETVCVAVTGPSGAGKSSLIAWVCSGLPDDHVALRVPVAGTDDPRDVSAVAKLTLSIALDAIEMEQHQRDALVGASADDVTLDRPAKPEFGGKLGGGPIPAEVHAQVGTLRTQLRSGQLAGDRLAGLDRLIDILVAQDRTPIFVLEDTEAAIGAGDGELVEGFITGPLAAFMQEVDAPLLVAMQDHLIADSDGFRRLAPSMVRIPLTDGLREDALAGIAAILAQRIEDHDLQFGLGDVVAEDALREFVSFYEENDGSLRLMLAAAQSAAEHAANMSSEILRAPHARAGVADWRTER